LIEMESKDEIDDYDGTSERIKKNESYKEQKACYSRYEAYDMYKKNITCKKKRLKDNDVKMINIDTINTLDRFCNDNNIKFKYNKESKCDLHLTKENDNEYTLALKFRTSYYPSYTKCCLSIDVDIKTINEDELLITIWELGHVDLGLWAMQDHLEEANFTVISKNIYKFNKSKNSFTLVKIEDEKEVELIIREAEKQEQKNERKRVNKNNN